jgi:hypothetical protein
LTVQLACSGTRPSRSILPIPAIPPRTSTATAVRRQFRKELPKQSAWRCSATTVPPARTLIVRASCLGRPKEVSPSQAP